MTLAVKRFPPPLEAQFRAIRTAALAEINATTYWLVAFLVMVFALWDRFVDPGNWRSALGIRAAGAALILVSGVVQRVSGRVDWALGLARVRYATAVVAVAGALAVLERGYEVGIAGLVAVLLSGPYIAIDRRDLLVLNAVPLLGIGLVMHAAELDRFTVINSAIFVALALAISLLLARVFEASNRRGFLLEQDLMREARTDGLTGLLNRRALDEVARIELKRSARGGTPLSVILCDVDHFKLVSDRHGHAAGDRAIRAIADCLRGAVRETDALGRWGGEEFLAILPATDAHAAGLLAERMRSLVERADLPLDAALRVTLSLGVAQLAHGDAAGADPWGDLVKAADDAMYRAKAAGRNRVVVAGAPAAGAG